MSKNLSEKVCQNDGESHQAWGGSPVFGGGGGKNLSDTTFCMSFCINELSKEPQRERSTVNTHTQLSTRTGAQTGPSVFNFLGFWPQRLSDDLYSSGYYSWHPVDTCLMSALLKKKKKKKVMRLFSSINHEPFCSFSSNQPLVGL